MDIIAWKYTRGGPLHLARSLAFLKEFGMLAAQHAKRLMESAGAQQRPGGPDVETFISIALTAAKVMAYAAAVVPVLVKGGFYAVGALYLGRQEVKRLFEQSVEPQAPFGSAAATS